MPASGEIARDIFNPGHSELLEEHVLGGRSRFLGDTEPLNEDGYAEVAGSCCVSGMEQFARRVVKDLGLVVCHEGGLAGMIGYHTCGAQGVQSYVKLQNDIKGSASGPCAWVAEPGYCPDIDFADCGSYPDDFHRRRVCNAATSAPYATTALPVTSAQATTPASTIAPGYTTALESTSTSASTTTLSSTILKPTTTASSTATAPTTTPASAVTQAPPTTAESTMTPAPTTTPESAATSVPTTTGVPTDNLPATTSTPNTTTASACCSQQTFKARTMYTQRTEFVSSSSVAEFNCSAHGGAIQVLKNSEGGYNVSELDIASGIYNTIYNIPSNSTSPNFARLNAVAVHPIDSRAYGVLGVAGESFIVRFDAAKIEFIGKLPFVGAKGVVAGAFGPTGTFYFKDTAWPSSALYWIDDLHTMSGSEDQSSSPSVTPGSFALIDNIHDVVAIRGDFDGSGSDADYVMGIVKFGGLVVVKKAAGGASKRWDIELSGNDGAIAFGAAWNFQGEVYFSDNGGEGVFLIPTADLDLSMTAPVQLLHRGLSQATDSNDGMNCMQVETPFAQCDAGDVEMVPGADGSCPSGSVRRR